MSKGPKQNDELSRYRDQVSAIFTTNIKTVLASPHWDDKQKAGTLILLATGIISHAAFLTASVDPVLRNAPPEAQIDDLLTLLREVLVVNKPISKTGLSVVKGGKE